MPSKSKVLGAIQGGLQGVPDKDVLAERVFDALSGSGYEIVDGSAYGQLVNLRDVVVEAAASVELER